MTWKVAETNYDGAIVALFLDQGAADKLTVEGGEEQSNLHISLVYLCDDASAVDDEQWEAARTAIEDIAAKHSTLKGRVGGIGRFQNGEEQDPCLALVDIPGLVDLQNDLAHILMPMFGVKEEHGFTPHITIKYEDHEKPHPLDGEDFDIPLAFNSVTLARGKVKENFPLSKEILSNWHEANDPSIGVHSDSWSAPANDTTFSVDPQSPPGRMGDDPMPKTPTNWVYLNGKVGFGDNPHNIIEELAEAQGLAPHEVRRLSNLLVRNQLPSDTDIAHGIMQLSRNRQTPAIHQTTVDRNHVWDTVHRAFQTKHASSLSIAYGMNDNSPAYDHIHSEVMHSENSQGVGKRPLSGWDDAQGSTDETYDANDQLVSVGDYVRTVDGLVEGQVVFIDDDPYDSYVWIQTPHATQPTPSQGKDIEKIQAPAPTDPDQWHITDDVYETPHDDPNYQFDLGVDSQGEPVKRGDRVQITDMNHGLAGRTGEVIAIYPTESGANDQSRLFEVRFNEPVRPDVMDTEGNPVHDTYVMSDYVTKQPEQTVTNPFDTSGDAGLVTQAAVQLRRGERVRSTRDDSSYGEEGSVLDTRTIQEWPHIEYLVKWDDGIDPQWTWTVEMIAPEAPDTLDSLTDSPSQQEALVHNAGKYPKTKKCKYCKEQATHRVVWAEGMGYVPCCDDHIEKAKAAIDDPTDIDGVEKWTSVGEINSVERSSKLSRTFLSHSYATGFIKEAAKINDLADKARTQVAMGLEKWIDKQADWLAQAKIKNQFGKGKDEVSEGQMIEQYRSQLAEQMKRNITQFLINMPDESFKAMPWVARMVKKGDIDLTTPGRNFDHAVDIAGQTGELMHQLRQNNKPVPDINQMDFKGAQDWLYKTRAEMRTETGGWKERKTVMQLDDGYTIDQLTNKEDCTREGEIMHHCVGGYGSAVEEGKTTIYSLREKDGTPHVTIEIIPADQNHSGVDQVTQVFGYNDGPPKQDDIPRIREFFDKLRGDGHQLEWAADEFLPEYITDARDLEDFHDTMTQYQHDLDREQPDAEHSVSEMMQRMRDSGSLAAAYGFRDETDTTPRPEVDWDQLTSDLHEKAKSGDLDSDLTDGLKMLKELGEEPESWTDSNLRDMAERESEDEDHFNPDEHWEEIEEMARKEFAEDLESRYDHVNDGMAWNDSDVDEEGNFDEREAELNFNDEWDSRSWSYEENARDEVEKKHKPDFDYTQAGSAYHDVSNALTEAEQHTHYADVIEREATDLIRAMTHPDKPDDPHAMRDMQKQVEEVIRRLRVYESRQGLSWHGKHVKPEALIKKLNVALDRKMRNTFPSYGVQPSLLDKNDKQHLVRAPEHAEQAKRYLTDIEGQLSAQRQEREQRINAIQPGDTVHWKDHYGYTKTLRVQDISGNKISGVDVSTGAAYSFDSSRVILNGDRSNYGPSEENRQFDQAVQNTQPIWEQKPSQWVPMEQANLYNEDYHNTPITVGDTVFNGTAIPSKHNGEVIATDPNPDDETRNVTVRWPDGSEEVYRGFHLDDLRVVQRTSAWKMSYDLQGDGPYGYTNWDTSETALMMNSEQATQQMSRKLVERGADEDKFSEWAIKKIIGPYNQQRIEDAQEWNDVPEHDRLDPNYEDFKDKHGDNPRAMDLRDNLIGGPDVGDYTPNTIDPNKVNWYEIMELIKDNLDEDAAFERDQQRMEDKGWTFGLHGHDDQTNQMMDAWMKHHGIKGENRGDWLPEGGTREYHQRMQMPAEHLKMDEGEFTPEQYNEWQAKGTAEPRVQSYGWTTLNDVQHGRANQWQMQRMQEALAGQGYTPEQIEQIMTPKWGTHPETGQPIIKLAPPKQPDPSLDQPGDLTLPPNWSKVTSWQPATWKTEGHKPGPIAGTRVFVKKGPDAGKTGVLTGGSNQGDYWFVRLDSDEAESTEAWSHDVVPVIFVNLMVEVPDIPDTLPETWSKVKTSDWFSVDDGTDVYGNPITPPTDVPATERSQDIVNFMQMVHNCGWSGDPKEWIAQHADNRPVLLQAWKFVDEQVKRYQAMKPSPGFTAQQIQRWTDYALALAPVLMNALQQRQTHLISGKPKIDAAPTGWMLTSTDYRLQHQPFADGPSIDRMEEIFQDAYKHPEWYGLDGVSFPESRAEATQALMSAKGNPDAPIRIYRALPHGITTINSGDWVSTAKAYAETHAMQNDNPADDWPVITAVVPAKTVMTGGSDLLEWGYFGPSIEAQPAQGLGTQASYQPGDCNDSNRGIVTAADEDMTAGIDHMFAVAKATFKTHLNSANRAKTYYKDAGYDESWYKMMLSKQIDHYCKVARDSFTKQGLPEWRQEQLIDALKSQLTVQALMEGWDLDEDAAGPSDMYISRWQRVKSIFTKSPIFTPTVNKGQAVKMGMGQAGDLPEGIEFSMQDYSAQRRDAAILIHATLPGNPTKSPDGAIGHLVVSLGDYPQIKDVAVHERYRRMGVASAMLNYAEEQLGKYIRHSGDLSDDGEAWMQATSSFSQYDENVHIVKINKTLVGHMAEPDEIIWGVGTEWKRWFPDKQISVRQAQRLEMHGELDAHSNKESREFQEKARRSRSIPTQNGIHTRSGKVLDLGWVRVVDDYDHLLRTASTERMSFKVYADKLQALADKARRKLLEGRPDIDKWLDSLIDERYINEVRKRGNAYPVTEQEKASWKAQLERMYAQFIESLPDESFKAWPWAIRELKSLGYAKPSWDHMPILALGVEEGSPTDFGQDFGGYSMMHELPGGLNHFADIVGQVGEMLHDMRKNNKPTPDLNQMSFTQAEQWMMKERSKKIEENQGWEDAEHEHTYANGWTVDAVRTEQDLLREGELMGHCVGGYYPSVNVGDSLIYSLRDAKGMPHATIEIDGHSMGVIQVQGKGNGEPNQQYQDMIKEFFEDWNRISGEHGNEDHQLHWAGEEERISDLRDLYLWWESIGEGKHHSGPYGLPVQGAVHLNDPDELVTEAMSYHVNRNGGSQGGPWWNGSDQDLSKALYAAFHSAGDDLDEARQHAEEKLQDWHGEDMGYQQEDVQDMAKEHMDESQPPPEGYDWNHNYGEETAVHSETGEEHPEGYDLYQKAYNREEPGAQDAVADSLWDWKYKDAGNLGQQLYDLHNKYKPTGRNTRGTMPAEYPDPAWLREQPMLPQPEDANAQT